MRRCGRTGRKLYAPSGARPFHRARQWEWQMRHAAAFDFGDRLVQALDIGVGQRQLGAFLG